MCGIVGARHDWLVARGLDPEAAMRDAVDSLRWRGPDGVGVVRAGAWWLGCARLAIGPKNSRQPLVRRGGRFVCVMNGAVTNARELWPRFLRGVEQRTQLPNDAWLPLLAVERRDHDLLASLRGHHAYAVVDVHTGELVLGRDRYGEKPLLCVVEWVGDVGTLVALASTPVALHRLGATARRSPPPFWFRLGWTPEASGYVDDRHRVTPLPWPGPFVARRSDPLWMSTWPNEDAIRRPVRAPRRSVHDELCASVARCIDTRVPVALALSGGLDSSCLAVALHAIGRRVPAYQLRAAHAPRREREAAAAVAARTQLELRAVDIGTEALDALPFLTSCAGLPLGDPSVLALHALARVAAADGIRVLLSGEGADELFRGYRRYRALARLPRARWLRRFAPRWSMRYPARWLRAVTAPDPILALLAVTPPAFGAAVLEPGEAQDQYWCDSDDNDPPEHGLVARAVERDLVGYLRCDLLPKVDVATMAAGIESRCPYLEGDYVAAGPRDLGKRPLREAFASELPREVLSLPKTGFALPLDRWFRGELPWLDLLAESRTQQRPHLRPGGVAKVVDMHRRGSVDLGHGLYLLVAFELYLRARDQENPAARHTAAPPAT